MNYKHSLIGKSYLSLFLLAFPLLTNSMQAQISMPNGNILNLNTSNDFLYIETRIYFHTGAFKPGDYKWQKVFDSLDTRWFVTACFNGECRNELADSGNFINDYGLDDTTGFIAFHVETYKYDGTSKIRYKIYNKYDSSDHEDLIFNIDYRNISGIGEYSEMNPYQVKISNPANKVISIMNANSSIGDIFLYDVLGKEICAWNINSLGNEMIKLDLPTDISGVFVLKLRIDGKLKQQKIIINQ